MNKIYFSFSHFLRFFILISLFFVATTSNTFSLTIPIDVESFKKPLVHKEPEAPQEPEPQYESNAKQEPNIPAPDKDQIKPLPKITATTYFLVDQKTFACAGSYGKKNYKESDKSKITVIFEDNSEKTFEVCTRFLQALRMEGSGTVYNENDEAITVGISGWDSKNSRHRFKNRGNCRFSYGATGDCLVPYHSIAADLKSFKTGSIVFIESARGLVLPNDEVHSGYFRVQDTGGAFRGAGLKKIDLFVGSSNDQSNTFKQAGLVGSKGGIKDASIVSGSIKESAEAEIERILKTFEEDEELFSLKSENERVFALLMPLHSLLFKFF